MTEVLILFGEALLVYTVVFGVFGWVAYKLGLFKKL